MISILCECGETFDFRASTAAGPMPCPACRGIVRLAFRGAPVATATLHERLIVRAGPQGVGEQVFLAGDGPLHLGKLPGKQILLSGRLVSRSHCHLERVKGEWWVRDEYSTNGLYLNGTRIFAHALQDGDVLGIGEYEFMYRCRPHAGRNTNWAAAIVRHEVPLRVLDEPEDGDSSATIAVPLDAPAHFEISAECDQTLTPGTGVIDNDREHKSLPPLSRPRPVLPPGLSRPPRPR